MTPVKKIKLLLLMTVALMQSGCGEPTYTHQPAQTATPPSVVAQVDPASTDLNLHALEKQTIAQFERLAPSVVYVTNLGVRRVGFSRDVTSIPQGTGSGFIWDKNGTIITNFHVINGAQDVEVTLSDGSVWKAQPVGIEPEKDLAVIKIEAPADQLTPIPIGRSSGLKVGQHVSAIGNPFGFDHTLTTGIISGLDREIRSPTQRPIQGVIQTDAAINPGNSGGPLLDSQGRLIGMNTAIYSPSGAYAGIGFAVPVDDIGRMIPELIAHGKVTKPGLGVSVANEAVTRRLNVEGVLILDVSPQGPAEKAGLRATTRTRFGQVSLGDVIVRIDETRLKNIDDLYRLLDRKKVGDKVTVEYLREGKLQTVDVVLERVN
jgi:protease Do-like 1, chloroplastic